VLGSSERHTPAMGLRAQGAGEASQRSAAFSTAAASASSKAAAAAERASAAAAQAQVQAALRMFYYVALGCHIPLCAIDRRAVGREVLSVACCLHQHACQAVYCAVFWNHCARWSAQPSWLSVGSWLPKALCPRFGPKHRAMHASCSQVTGARSQQALPQAPQAHAGEPCMPHAVRSGVHVLSQVLPQAPQAHAGEPCTPHAVRSGVHVLSQVLPQAHLAHASEDAVEALQARLRAAEAAAAEAEAAGAEAERRAAAAAALATAHQDVAAGQADVAEQARAAAS